MSGGHAIQALVFAPALPPPQPPRSRLLAWQAGRRAGCALRLLPRQRERARLIRGPHQAPPTPPALGRVPHRRTAPALAHRRQRRPGLAMAAVTRPRLMHQFAVSADASRRGLRKGPAGLPFSLPWQRGRRTLAALTALARTSPWHLAAPAGPPKVARWEMTSHRLSAPLPSSLAWVRRRTRAPTPPPSSHPPPASAAPRGRPSCRLRAYGKLPPPLPPVTAAAAPATACRRRAWRRVRRHPQRPHIPTDPRTAPLPPVVLARMS